MRHLIAILVLCAMDFGCAATSATNTHTRDTNRPKQSYLVIRAPSAVLGDVDPSQFRIVLRVKLWNDHPIFYRSYSTYCDVRADHFECVAPVEDANLEFELRAIWLQPDPANLKPEQRAVLKAIWDDPVQFKRYFPDKFCDTVEVGVSVGHYGWSGGNASADRWMELSANRDESWCQYEVPYDFVVGSRKK